MAFDAARYVHRYYASLAPVPGNEYPRLRAWEYLWEYVWDPSRSWDDLTAPNSSTPPPCTWVSTWPTGACSVAPRDCCRTATWT